MILIILQTSCEYLISLSFSPSYFGAFHICFVFLFLPLNTAATFDTVTILTAMEDFDLSDSIADSADDLIAVLVGLSKPLVRPDFV